MEMTELCGMALWYGTDKAPPVPVSANHGYTPVYHELFKDRRNIKRVLEIGVLGGQSLFMWRDYFPEAQIYGLDNNPDTMIDLERIQTLVCDQGNADDLKGIRKEIGKNFDFICDDGSHDPVHQVLTARYLIPLLSPTGIYVIEDVMHPDIVVPQMPFKCELRVLPQNVMNDNRLIIIRGEDTR